VVSTHLKNIGQIGNLPQNGVKITNISNHRLEMLSLYLSPSVPCVLENTITFYYFLPFTSGEKKEHMRIQQ